GDDQARPGRAGDPDRRSGGNVVVRRLAVLVAPALGLDEDAPISAGRDANADERLAADEIARRERRRALGAPKDREEHQDEPESECAADRADGGRLATVDVEDLRREQAADAEHRDEPEGQRHQGDAAEIGADMERVEEPTEDVVDENRDEEQPAADQRADDENEVFDRDLDHRPLATSAPTPWTGCPRSKDTPGRSRRRR